MGRAGLGLGEQWEEGDGYVGGGVMRLVVDDESWSGLGGNGCHYDFKLVLWRGGEVCKICVTRIGRGVGGYRYSLSGDTLRA